MIVQSEKVIACALQRLGEEITEEMSLQNKH